MTLEEQGNPVFDQKRFDQYDLQMGALLPDSPARLLPDELIDKLIQGRR
jgi:hypothetical protein